MVFGVRAERLFADSLNAAVFFRQLDKKFGVITAGDRYGGPFTRIYIWPDRFFGGSECFGYLRGALARNLAFLDPLTHHLGLSAHLPGKLVWVSGLIDQVEQHLTLR